VDRASASGAESRWFDPSRAYHFFSTPLIFFVSCLILHSGQVEIGEQPDPEDRLETDAALESPAGNPVLFPAGRVLKRNGMTADEEKSPSRR
jgi:hypothetical protein